MTSIMMIEVIPNGMVARHTHPGVEMLYVLQAQVELTIDGQAPRLLRMGDSITAPAGVPHTSTNRDCTATCVC